MKTIYLCFLSVVLFVACSDEEKETTQEPVLNVSVSKTSSTPANPFNPYDEVGAIYAETMSVYYAKDTHPVEVDSVLHEVEDIAFTLPAFSSFSGSYVSPTPAAIDSILTAPSDRLGASILDPTLSLKAQQRLSSFVDTALLYATDESDYAVFYAHATSFEFEVHSDFGYTTYDKQVLLISSSILRYTVYAKKKKPKKNTDPEWDLMVGNFTAAIEGAKISKGTAAVFALVTGIAENDL